jgi:hypothetical protein
MNHKRLVLSRPTAKERGIATGRRRLPVWLTALLALGLLTLAAFAPAESAAADVAFHAAKPESVSTDCADGADQTALDRNFGTFAGCWYSHIAVTNPGRSDAGRKYGTWAGVWTGYLDSEAALDPNRVALDRSYGTFTSAWLTNLSGE